MALIYANAVNKRMNNPIAKSKKKNTQSCPFRDESPSDLRENRRRSSSREKTPIRKVSCTVSQQSHSVGSCSPHAGSNHAEHLHRPVQRSKTSCGDLLKKIDEDAAQRKTSHPVMSQSTTSQQLSGSNKGRNDDKQAQAKKSLIQKYNLEHKYEKKNIETGKDGERRRSISLNPDQWTYQLAVGNDRNKEKDGAFQKMKRKFSKWKLSGRFE